MSQNGCRGGSSVESTSEAPQARCFGSIAGGSALGTKMENQMPRNELKLQAILLALGASPALAVSADGVPKNILFGRTDLKGCFHGNDKKSYDLQMKNGQRFPWEEYEGRTILIKGAPDTSQGHCGQTLSVEEVQPYPAGDALGSWDIYHDGYGHYVVKFPPWWSSPSQSRGIRSNVSAETVEIQVEFGGKKPALGFSLECPIGNRQKERKKMKINGRTAEYCRGADTEALQALAQEQELLILRDRDKRIVIHNSDADGVDPTVPKHVLLRMAESFVLDQ